MTPKKNIPEGFEYEEGFDERYILKVLREMGILEVTRYDQGAKNGFMYHTTKLKIAGRYIRVTGEIFPLVREIAFSGDDRSKLLFCNRLEKEVRKGLSEEPTFSKQDI